MRDLEAIITIVRPELERHEKARREQMSRRLDAVKRIGLTALAIWAAGFVVGLFVHSPYVGSVTFGAIAIVAAVMVYRRIILPERAFRREFELGVIGSIARAMEPDITFTPDRGVPLADFTKSRLFDTTPDRYRSEDGLHGKIGQTSVHVSEVHAEAEHERRDSKGNTHTSYETIFDGIFMVADFHKHFRGTTRVLPDRAERLLGGFGRALQDFRPFSSEDLVYTEDPVFEEQFVVYGSDQIESRYILTTSMLSRILELKLKWHNDVRLSFIDSNVYLSISHTGDLLEPSIDRAISPETIGKIVSDLAACFDLVEDLNLNTRIWSKE